MRRALDRSERSVRTAYEHSNKDEATKSLCLTMDTQVGKANAIAILSRFVRVSESLKTFDDIWPPKTSREREEEEDV